MTSSPIFIGWAETDITPDRPVELCGQYYQRVSRGVHTPLKAAAWAAESKQDQAILISADLGGVPRELQEEVRKRLAGRLKGFDLRNLIVTVTHTHCAPHPLMRFGWGDEAQGIMSYLEYGPILAERMAQAAETAWKNRKPAGMSHCLGHAVLGHNRRVWYADGTAEMYGQTDREDFIGMEGGEDSGVEMLFTWDPQGKPTGVVLNFACPSQVMEATYVLSADFVGEARQMLREHFGENFGVLALIGAAGDLAPRDLPRNYRGEPLFWAQEGAAELGRRLARAVEDNIESASKTVQTNVPLQHVVRDVSLPIRRAGYEEYIAAQREFDALDSTEPKDPNAPDSAFGLFLAEVKCNEAVPGRPGPHDSKLAKFVKMRNAEAVIQRYKTQDAQPNYVMEMHVLRVGDVAMASNPFELYNEYGQMIKARSRAAQTFIVQLSCDMPGYLPTAKAVYGGTGYRGYGALIINGNVGPEGGRKLVDETVSTINSLWKDE